MCYCTLDLYKLNLPARQQLFNDMVGCERYLVPVHLHS